MKYYYIGTIRRIQISNQALQTNNQNTNSQSNGAFYNKQQNLNFHGIPQYEDNQKRPVGQSWERFQNNNISSQNPGKALVSPRNNAGGPGQSHYQ